MLALPDEVGLHAHSARTFDRDALLERCAGEEEIALLLLNTFRERLPGMLVEIGEAIHHDGGLNELGRKVHVLKGNAGELGACWLHAAASLLEDAVRAQQRRKLPDLYERVEREAAEFLGALSTVLDSQA